MVFKKGHKTWNKGKTGIFSSESLALISKKSTVSNIKTWKDPKVRAMRIKGIIKSKCWKTLLDPETRAKADTTLRIRYRTGDLKQWNTGLTKETSLSLKRMSEKKKIQNSGERNPNWKGGISRLPYGGYFNKTFKKNISDKFNSVCQLCNKYAQLGSNTKYGGCVHHINYNKLDGREINCVWVCRSCNGKCNANRDYWISWWSSKLKIGINELCK